MPRTTTHTKRANTGSGAGTGTQKKPVQPIKLPRKHLHTFIQQHGYTKVTPNDLAGKWTVTNSESVASFVISKAPHTTECHTKCCKHPCRNFDGPVKFLCKTQIENATWKADKMPKYITSPKGLGYHIVVHTNGVLTFVPFAECSFQQILLLARIDSKSWPDFVKNVTHAARHGCFCFAVVEKVGKDLYIRRYNRWTDKTLSTYWLAKKER